MKKRINVMIDEQNLIYLDEHASAYGLNRSAMLNVILHQHFDAYIEYQKTSDNSDSVYCQ